MSFHSDQPSHLALRSIIAEKTNKLVIWVGSGLSASAGLPTWRQLKESLVAQLKEKAHEISQPDATSLKKAAIRAEDTDNYWLAFQILRKHLGKASYQAAIREALRPATTASCPEVYHNIWNLRPAGVLNLNLDRLATRALGEVSPGRYSTEFSGRQANEFLHVLRNPHPFIANLHGVTDNASSWVLTKGELDYLVGSQGYQTLIKSCLTTTTILFIGITVDDAAVAAHLRRLTTAGIDIGNHYWLTNRRDLGTDIWAEHLGVQVIRYRNHGDIPEFFDDILKFVPEEEDSIPPVVPRGFETINDEDLPNPQEILQLRPEEIREILNARAKTILSSKSSASYSEYQQFITKYDEAIYHAWYISEISSPSKFCGFTLARYAARGAFGRVYEAKSPDGSQVAIKVLLEEVRRDPAMLRSFRRGVRSMQYLVARGVVGMVEYKEASEIPAFVVMDWVEGPTLTEARSSHLINDWESILKIGCQMTDIISRAHAIPERVLHRDIRPSNIMLEGVHSDSIPWRVVVLDFDLSWHLGALEQSVVHGPVFGYLAPEQIEDRPGVSTRHAAVDSFGVGMTLYFMISGKDPIPEQHLHFNWAETVLGASARHGSPTWQSLPFRYARLVTNATQDSQSDRWDLAQIRDELRRLMDALMYPDRVASAELIADEIAARTDRTYHWSDETGTAIIKLVSGLVISISGDESKRQMVINLNWSSSDRQERKNVAKWMAPAADRCKKILRSSGWTIRTTNIQPLQSVVIEASLTVSRAASTLSDQAKAISEIKEQLNFQ